MKIGIMQIRPYLLFSFVALIMILLGVELGRAASTESNIMSSSQYNATIVECMADEDEEEFLATESEVSRRLLAANRPSKISYGSLQKPAVCNAMIYGNCITPVGRPKRPCTLYNRCKRSPR